MRKVETCIQCGEAREIAARGLCFSCYRREQRANDREALEFHDRHNPALRREHRRLIRGFAAIMGGLSDLGVDRADVLAIRERLMPYLVPVADYLLGVPVPAAPVVNGEHGEKGFTVHKGVDSTKEVDNEKPTLKQRRQQ